MKFLIVFLGAIVGVFAHPDAGYNYQPSGSYLPSRTGSVISEVSTSYGSPNILGNINTGYTGGLTNEFTGGLTGGLINTNLGVNMHQNERNVYFFAAPDDESTARFRVYVQPSSRSNSKIIFVKTPSYGGVIPEVIAPQSQTEEKTKVYVLVRKQEHGGSVTIPSSLGVKEGKPEVFFIKYRNHQEAEAAVNQGLQGGNVGTHLENLGNEQVFVRNLEASLGRAGAVGGINAGIGGIGNSLSGGQYGLPSVTDTKTVYGPPGESGPYKK